VREFVRAVGVIEWVFVVALLSGVLSAILLLASFLERQLEAAPVTMSAIFLGLVIGATLVAVRELREPGARSRRDRRRRRGGHLRGARVPGQCRR
jgi:uncharacterized membrane protein